MPFLPGTIFFSFRRSGLVKAGAFIQLSGSQGSGQLSCNPFWGSSCPETSWELERGSGELGGLGRAALAEASPRRLDRWMGSFLGSGSSVSVNASFANEMLSSLR